MFLLTIQAFNLLNILVNMERALHRAPLKSVLVLNFQGGRIYFAITRPSCIYFPKTRNS
jgi:hypothetical protein